MKMRIETGTVWMTLPLIVGTYGTELGWVLDDLSDEYTREDFNEVVVKCAKEYLEEIFDTLKEELGEVKVSEIRVASPQFYNYSNDELEFDLSFDDDLVRNIDITEKFFEYASKFYGSHSGFISSMPYQMDRYINALMSDRDGVAFAKAISMYIGWVVYQYSDEFEHIQRDFVDDVTEYCNYNGMCNCEDDEE